MRKLCYLESGYMFYYPPPPAKKHTHTHTRKLENHILSDSVLSLGEALRVVSDLCVLDSL